MKRIFTRRGVLAHSTSLKTILSKVSTVQLQSSSSFVLRNYRYSSSNINSSSSAEEQTKPKQSPSDNNNPESSTDVGSSSPNSNSESNTDPRSQLLLKTKTKSKSSGDPKDHPLFSWTTAIVTTLVAVLMLLYYQFERRRKIEKIAEPISNTTIGNPLIGGTFTLVDHKGRPVSDLNFRDRYCIFYFGFTNCPDICPAELGKLAKAIDMLDAELIRRKVTQPEKFVIPVFISVDPFRDTIDKVANYVKQMHPRMIGLTGTPKQVESMTKAYRVYSWSSKEGGVTEIPEEGADYLIDHSIYFYLMDKKGRAISFFGSDKTSEYMAQKMLQDLKDRGEVQDTYWEKLLSYFK